MADANQDTILLEIMTAISVVNAELPEGVKLRSDLEARLTGPGRELDSLGLILLLSEIEERLSKAFNTSFAFDDIILESTDNPYETVQSLYDMAVSRFDGQGVKA